MGETEIDFSLNTSMNSIKTIILTEKLDKELVNHSKKNNISQSKIVRNSLERYFEK